MSSVTLASPFLIRATGVPFEHLLRLATSESSRLARALLVRQKELAAARQRAEEFVGARASGLSAEESRACRALLRGGEKSTADLPGALAEFIRQREATAGLERELASTLSREMEAARASLLESSRTVLPGYLLFSAGEFRDRLPVAGEPLPPRNARAREHERHLYLYLQRVCGKNDTYSEFGPSAWGTIADTLRFEPQPGIAERISFLERWAAHTLAAAAGDLAVPAMEPEAFAILASEMAPDSPWHERAQHLQSLGSNFAGTADLEQRAALMSEARRALDDLGGKLSTGRRFLYAAANPIAEECRREANFSITHEMVEQLTADIEPWFGLWRDVYNFVAHRVAQALAGMLRSADAKDGAMPLPEFLAHCAAKNLPLTGVGLVAPAAIAFAEVKAAFRKMAEAHAHEAEWNLTAKDCAFVRENFEFPAFDEYTYPAADLQLSARSFEAVTLGEYEWIVGEFHPPVALLHHALYWSCPDKPALRAALARTTGGKPSVHYGFFAADFTAHTTVRLFDALPELTYFVADQRADKSWRQVAPAETEVFLDETTGDVGFRRAGNKEYLGSFARAWLIPLGFHPFHFGGLPHLPRLRCGRAIVQRRAWIISEQDLPAADYQGVAPALVLAVEKLRAARDLPRYVYLRPTEGALRRSGAEGRDKDTKPVYLDLESYLSLEILNRWMKKAGELELTEMLPDPEHLCWQEADGHRTFELRSLLVPRS